MKINPQNIPQIDDKALIRDPETALERDWLLERIGPADVLGIP